MPSDTAETIISFSGSKLYLSTCIGVLAIAACCCAWDFHIPSTARGMALYNAIVTNASVRHAMLGICIALCGSVFMSNISKMFGKRVGVILNSEGITDYTSFSSVGFIPWEDILEFKLREFRNSQWIAVRVKNPNHYINRPAFWKQAGLMLNPSRGITPVCITPTQLELSSEELLALCNEYLEKFRASTKTISTETVFEDLPQKIQAFHENI